MSLITSLRLAELKLTEGSNEEKLTYGYDKDDLVTSLRRTGASNANSLMLTRSTTAGFLMAADIGTPTILREEVTYDGWGAPTEIRGKWGGAGMGQIGLTYDAAGRVVQKIEAYAFPVAEPAMPNMSNETWSYTYDAAGRLESATEIPSAPRVYTYDARGNRNVTVVDEQDRATQVGAPGQPDYTFYTYDAHGNVATRIVGGTTHTYTYPVHEGACCAGRGGDRRVRACQRRERSRSGQLEWRRGVRAGRAPRSSRRGAGSRGAP